MWEFVMGTQSTVRKCARALRNGAAIIVVTCVIAAPAIAGPVSVGVTVGGRSIGIGGGGGGGGALGGALGGVGGALGGAGGSVGSLGGGIGSSVDGLSSGFFSGGANFGGAGT